MNILITGATSGIGEQLCRDYCAAGHHVIACGRDVTKLQALDNAVALRGQLTLLAFDVTDRAAVARVLGDYARENPIDTAILNAGVCEYVDEPKHLDAALVERVFAANFFGVVYCAETLLPNLKAGNRIAVVDSMARQFPFVRAEAYGASKAAVHYFAQSLSADLADTGIEIVTISPGFVETPMTDRNDFDMPMRISVADAAKAIMTGLEKGKRHIAFPTLFGWVLAAMQRLPMGMQMALAKRMKQPKKQMR